jgi:phosphatidate cytidylyltransferase
MALNIATFKTRALTALFFVAVMLTGLLWNFWSFLILFTVIHFGCWLEYLKLVEKIYSTTIDVVIKWFFAICGFTLMFVLGIQHFWSDIYLFSFKISLKLLIWIFQIVCLIIFIIQNKQIPSKAKWMCFAGFIYISLSFALLLNLRDNIVYTFEDLEVKFDKIELPELGKIYTCIIFFSIWINDTMAYLVGSFIGKTPFSKISPKKTWEGTIGGSVLCVLVIGLIYSYTFTDVVIPGFVLSIAAYNWFIIAAICAIAGTAGDLFESKLKRMANVKDSGAIMPGHGGFLDRFDSLLFAAPAVWLYVYFFMK